MKEATFIFAFFLVSFGVVSNCAYEDEVAEHIAYCNAVANKLHSNYKGWDLNEKCSKQKQESLKKSLRHHF